MSGHFDDEYPGAPVPMSPSVFRQQREAAGISDTHASLAFAYALAATATPNGPDIAPPPRLIQIGPLDV